MDLEKEMIRADFGLQDEVITSSAMDLQIILLQAILTKDASVMAFAKAAIYPTYESMCKKVDKDPDPDGYFKAYLFGK